MDISIKTVIVCSMMAFSGVALRAETTELQEARANATVLVGGVRSAPNNDNFLNIEGSGNPGFFSFGVAEFDLSGFAPAPETVDSVNSIQLVFTQSNASFTKDGNLAFYITTDLDASIAAGSTNLKYDSTNDPERGLGSQLQDLYFLGTGVFTQVGTGSQDTYTFTLSGAAQAYVREQFVNGGVFRIVIAPDNAAVAATWAGFNNNSNPGPQVSFEYTSVPEASSVSLLMLGGMALAGWRRRQTVLA